MQESPFGLTQQKNEKFTGGMSMVGSTVLSKKRKVGSRTVGTDKICRGRVTSHLSMRATYRLTHLTYNSLNESCFLFFFFFEIDGGVKPHRLLYSNSKSDLAVSTNT